MTAVVLSDIGCRRENNEDAVLGLPQCGVFAVADGMGGAAAGEVASRFTVEAIRDALRADLTLGGVVMLPDKDDTAGPTVVAGPVLFAGVLCHSATITVINKRFIQTP